jgi:RNA polymerase sigma-70 factor (ECF subfamily)
LALTQEQFDALVDEHAPALFRVAFRLVGDRHDAEDMVQETFRSAWKSRHRYEEGRGDRAWLVSILRRRVVDRWRKGKNLRLVSSNSPPDVGVNGDDPLAQHYSDEVQRALNQLDDKLRETLLMVVVGELTHQEVADELGVPLGTVLSRVSRARRRLRELLAASSVL